MINMAMDSSTQTSADNHTCCACNKLFDLAEKLQIELQKKDQELADKNQENQKLSTDLALENSQATKWKTELDSAQEIIHNHQMDWELFPVRRLYYFIKTHSGSSNGEFLYYSGEHDYYLRSSAGDQFPGFLFTKNSDGTFTIYIMLLSGQNKYWHTNTDSSKVKFTANKDDAGKFVLFFHQQNHHIGLLVDISTLDGYFLCIDNDNYVVANSRTPPAPTDKFMITPQL